MVAAINVVSLTDLEAVEPRAQQVREQTSGGLASLQ
jgi:hypothetical protein